MYDQFAEPIRTTFVRKRFGLKRFWGCQVTNDISFKVSSNKLLIPLSSNETSGVPRYEIMMRSLKYYLHEFERFDKDGKISLVQFFDKKGDLISIVVKTREIITINRDQTYPGIREILGESLPGGSLYWGVNPLG